jgi:glutamine cyclotransferase
LAVTACKDDKDTTTDTDNNSAAVKPPAIMEYNILKTYPHDPSSFTEGLFLLMDFYMKVLARMGKAGY